MPVHEWNIRGADGEAILGNVHLPEEQPRGVIIIAHGFKGYKDYGMLPRIAASCADAGYIAHRFNFSHSGMTNDIDTFARPDLFEADTWNKQVHDLRAIVAAINAGDLAGQGLPLILFGHSRGGVTALLTAGRHADDPVLGQLRGVVAAASPDRCHSLSEADAVQLLEKGFLESPSSRTGQVLRIGRAFLQEQLQEPEQHDVLAMVGKIAVPMLIVHGADDPTVAVQSADRLADAARGRAARVIIDGADHVFNTPNPLGPQVPASPQLTTLMSSMIDFADEVISMR